MKSLLSLFAAIMLLGNAVAAEPASDAAVQANPRVLMQTSLGDITLELYADKAPETVANFLQYTDEGFYDGTIFHRVIGDFMIQGGGFTPDMVKKPTRAPIINEADNGLRNKVFTIAMARTPVPHSATSQFFINVQNNSNLDFREKHSSRSWGYAVFGQVVDGRDVVNAIKRVKTKRQGNHGNVPVETVLIKKVSRINPTAEQSGAKQ